MQQIFFYFWKLCLLRESPSRIPSSLYVLGSVAIFYLLVALTTISLIQPEQTLGGVFGSVTVSLLIQATLTWGLLLFKGMSNHYVATLSALLGTNTIMLLIQLPVTLTLLNAENQNLTLLANSVSWVCLGWWLAIVGYIYHKAINISVLQGSAIAFMTELLGVIATITLFPTS